MLLSTPEQIEHYHKKGLWKDLRLDQVFTAHAEKMPDDLALIDDQSLHPITGRQPQCLTFARAERRAVGLTNFLTGIGMKSDTVVAMMLPPCVDAAILTLAASRMGFILAPLSPMLREADLKEKLEEINAKAIVCCTHFEDEPLAERIRNVAAEMFSIRFVFCLGDGVPDGLIELAPMMDDESATSDGEPTNGPVLRTANSVLAIHWASATSHPALPLGRSHNEYLSCARHVNEQTGIECGESLLLAHQLNGLVGFGAGLVAGLAAGARIIFHHFTTPDTLANSLEEFGCQHVILPQSQWPAIQDQLPMPAREQLLSISLVWNRLHPEGDVYRDNETAARLIDITNFNELALIAQLRRDPATLDTIPIGKINARQGNEAAWIETALFGLEETRAQFGDAAAGGELCLKGAMIPQRSFPVAGAIEGDLLPTKIPGFVETQIGCRAVTGEEEAASFRPLGDLSDILSLGGMNERADDLDQLYKDCDGVLDAASFLMEQDEGQAPILMAALVVEDREEGEIRFFHALEAKQVSSHKWPRGVVFVEAIPKKTDGSILRTELVAAALSKQVA